MKSNPFASLLRSPSYIDFQGVELVVPWAPASEWMRVIGRDARACSVALAENSDGLLVALAEGSLTLEALEKTSFDLIEEVSGHKWFTAIKLLHTAAIPDVLGELTLSGVDADRVSLGQWCAATYRILTRDLEKKDKLKLDFELDVPPFGYEDSWDDGNDYAAMLERARVMQGGKPGGQ